MAEAKKEEVKEPKSLLGKLKEKVDDKELVSIDPVEEVNADQQELF